MRTQLITNKSLEPLQLVVKRKTEMKKQIEIKLQTIMSANWEDRVISQKKVLFVEKMYNNKEELVSRAVVFDEKDDEGNFVTMNYNNARYRKMIDMLGVDSLDGITVEVCHFDGVMGNPVYTPGSQYNICASFDDADSVQYIVDIVE